VPRVEGLSLAADYWEIRQRNVIASAGSIADDTAALLAATQAALAAGQSIGQIDLGSGTANYKGDPAIVRLPVTQADRDFFAAYNATRPAGNQRAVVGAIDVIRTTYFNRSQQFVNGFDFDATYRLPKLSIGNFTVSTTWTYLNDFHAYNAAGEAPHGPPLEQRHGRRDPEVARFGRRHVAPQRMERRPVRVLHGQLQRDRRDDNAHDLGFARAPELHRAVLHRRQHAVPLCGR
jgi:hypothetical protein